MSKAATNRKKQRREAMVFRMLLVEYHNSIQRSKSEPEHYVCQCPANERVTFTLEYWHVNEQDKMAKSLMDRLYPEFDALDWDDHMDGHREAYELSLKWESAYPDDVCCDYYYEGCERAEKEDWTNWWFK